MVLSFSKPLIVAAWFVQRQGKAWVRLDTVSTQIDHEENSRRKRKALQTEMHEPSTQRRVKGRIKCKGTLRRLPVTERTRTRDPHRPEQVRRDVRGSGPGRGSAETDHTLQGLKIPITWRLP